MEKGKSSPATYNSVGTSLLLDVEGSVNSGASGGYKVYTKRWVTLGIVMFLQIANAMLWVRFPKFSFFHSLVAFQWC